MKVHKVYVHLLRAGRNVGRFNADLIFVEDDPIVVFEWGADGRPQWTVPLDPALLHKLTPPWPEADYMYEMAISDPRPLS